MWIALRLLDGRPLRYYAAGSIRSNSPFEYREFLRGMFGKRWEIRHLPNWGDYMYLHFLMSPFLRTGWVLCSTQHKMPPRDWRHCVEFRTALMLGNRRLYVNTSRRRSHDHWLPQKVHWEENNCVSEERLVCRFERNAVCFMYALMWYLSGWSKFINTKVVIEVVTFSNSISIIQEE